MGNAHCGITCIIDALGRYWRGMYEVHDGEGWHKANIRYRRGGFIWSMEISLGKFPRRV